MRRTIFRFSVATAAVALAGCSAIDDFSGPAVQAPGRLPGYEIAVGPGDTLDSVARRFNVPTSALAQANRLRAPYTLRPQQLLIIPPPATYQVRDGDTVAGIATNLGVDELALAQANGLRKPYRMRVGQVLRVPGGIGADGTVGPSSDIASSEPVDTEPAVSRRSGISAEALPPPPGVAVGSAARFEAPRAAPVPAPATPSLPAVPAPQSTSPSASPTALAPPVTIAAAPRISPVAPTPVPSLQPTNLVPPKSIAKAPDTPTPPPAPPTKSPSPPTVSADKPSFIRPVSGPVIDGFGTSSGGHTNEGINIGAGAGTPVRAAEGGTVIYTGNELAAFGNLVLIRHAGGWVTAYGHLGSVNVQKGATVSQGQSIGTVGQTGSVSTPQLHFEIRQGSKAVDPGPYLDGKS